ncbi:MAG TPA: putative sulfate exporter family transporter [Bacteroidia bacterium]|nr:putative sulfate exporter family transporter [Bacteroidia bacterium]
MSEEIKWTREVAAKPVFWAVLAMIIVFFLSASYALMLGLVVGIVFGNPFPKQSKVVTKYLLQGAIVGLGFGMNFTKVVEAGKDGFVFTVLTISAAMGFGFLLGRIFKVERIISYLISVGTAICGGSAIAAVSQVVRADEKDISVSIGTVFILNAIALFIFPPIGLYFGLTQQQFGVWAAIAIHDTSSVVGAAANYGNEALMVATTVKLARALWIVPLALLTSLVFKKQSTAASLPWFILFFIIASLVNTYTHIPQEISAWIVKISKIAFSITLFLIGAGISLNTIRKVGVRPLLQGVVLWMFILISSLFFILHY